MTKSTRPPFWRHRSQGGFLPSRAFYFSHTMPNGTWYADGFPVGSKAVMYDYVTPGFRQKSKAGGIVMSPMTRVIQSKVAEAKSNASGRINGNPAYAWGYLQGPRTIWTMGLGSTVSILPGEYSVHSSKDVDRLQTEASTKCLANVGRASTNTWETLAEAQKSIDMFWVPLKSWFTMDAQYEKKLELALRDELRRRNLHKWPLSRVMKYYTVRELLGASRAANLFLGYRYGIQPIIRSMDDINKSLISLLKPPYQTSRGIATSSASTNEEVTYSNSGYVWKTRKSITESIQVRAVSVDDIVMDWAYDYGFSVKSLITLPYELISYSFVADWFVNLGDYINAMANCLRPESLGQCMTTQVVRTGVWENLSQVSSPSSDGLIVPQLDLVREDAVNKWRTPGLRMPGIVVNSNFGFSNATRVADAVALLGQRVLRKVAFFAMR